MSNLHLDLTRARGREFLYELSVVPDESEKLKSAVIRAMNDIDLFHSSCQMMELGGHFSYNFATHELEYDDVPSGVTDQTAARKDFILYSVERIAARLFPEDGNRKVCVEEYLSGKLIDGSSYGSKKSYLQFATLKELEAGEKSLLKLLNKLREGRFLSLEAKKQKYIENFPQNPDPKALSSEILQKVKKHQMASSEGKGMQSQLITELLILQSILSDGKSCSGLELTGLFSKQVRSRFPDDLCDQIDDLKAYLVDKCDYTPPQKVQTPPKQPFKEQKKLRNKTVKHSFLSRFFGRIVHFARMLFRMFKRLIYS